MEKEGSYKFTAEGWLTDYRGQATLHAVGNCLVQAALRHASERGFGIEGMATRGAAWVLSRLAVEMESYPREGEEFTVTTWIEGAERSFSRRCFELSGADGGTLGFARSVWAAIGLETRRPVALAIPEFEPYFSSRPCPIEPPARLRPTGGGGREEGFRVGYTDIDFNGHMNSMRYVAHFLDLFGKGMYDTCDVARLDIAHLSECRFGDEVRLSLVPEREGSFALSARRDGTDVCRARIAWRGRRRG